jgi:hypothetical protein
LIFDDGLMPVTCPVQIDSSLALAAQKLKKQKGIHFMYTDCGSLEWEKRMLR